MIIEVERSQIGPLRLLLVEKPGLDPEFFAPRYYVTSRHDDARFFTAIEYAGHDRAHSERKFARIVEKARVEAGKDFT